MLQQAAGFLAAGTYALQASSAGGCHRHEEDHNRCRHENHWPNFRIRSHVAIPSLLLTIQAHADHFINVDPLRLGRLSAKACSDMDLSLQAQWSKEQLSLSSTAKIFVFTTDFVSQCSFCICQNVTMITLSVAGVLLLLNVALISSILSVDQLIG